MAIFSTILRLFHGPYIMPCNTDNVITEDGFNILNFQLKKHIARFAKGESTFMTQLAAYQMVKKECHA